MKRKKYLFYADQLLNDGNSHGLASGIATTDNAYTDLVKRHARQMIADGNGNFWFVKVEADQESTLWALENSTITMHDRYISEAAA